MLVVLVVGDVDVRGVPFIWPTRAKPGQICYQSRVRNYIVSAQNVAYQNGYKMYIVASIFWKFQPFHLIAQGDFRATACPW